MADNDETLTPEQEALLRRLAMLEDSIYPLPDGRGDLHADIDDIWALVDAARADADANRRAAARALDERDEAKAALERQWEANRRGIAAWQAKTGRDMEWPDHAALIEWLCDQVQFRRDEIDRLSAHANVGWDRAQATADLLAVSEREVVLLRQQVAALTGAAAPKED